MLAVLVLPLVLQKELQELHIVSMTLFCSLLILELVKAMVCCIE